MTKREPNLIMSSLSRVVTWNGHHLELEIYRLDDRPGWTLEVVNEKGTSTVWNDLFDTDDAAQLAFRTTLKKDGLAAFMNTATVIPFRQ